jgi:hypothetical protein
MGDDPIAFTLDLQAGAGKSAKVHPDHPFASWRLPLRQFSVIRAASAPHSVIQRLMRDQIILEIVANLLQLRVGHEVIATANLADRAVMILRDIGRSYARRRKYRFVDMTKN